MSQSAVDGANPDLDVTFVFGPACHLCNDAEAALAELATRLPLRITRVAAASETGRRLLMQHRAGMLPLVLINGRFLSSGRVPRGALGRIESDWTPRARADRWAGSRVLASQLAALSFACAPKSARRSSALPPGRHHPLTNPPTYPRAL